MVGVPRSTGCQTCLQRRIKCDELRPECSQCQRYGVTCPGYTKIHKFQDEGPLLRRRFGASKLSSNRLKRTEVTQIVSSPESIDERVAPSLVSRSMTKQQPEVFRDFVLTAFPRWFGLNKYRVHVPWTTYVASVLGQNPALDAAIYCITCAFLGTSHYDEKIQKSGREMYSKALVLFRDSMRHGASLASRESVSTSILLSLFEAYCRTEGDSWARHAGGAALLMSLRGAESHLSGFDRCLYLSFRSFLVAQAFVEGKPCIFEQPEWQSLIDQIRKEDMVDPRADEPVSVFIDISDRLFMEVVKVPGLVAQIRALSSGTAPEEIKALAARVVLIKERIRDLAADLRLAAAVRGYRSLGPNRASFIGPIPSTFPLAFANSLLRGADNCLGLLTLLYNNLTSTMDSLSGASSDTPIKHEQDDLTSSSAALPEPPRALLLRPLPFRIISQFRSSSGSSGGSSTDDRSVGETDTTSTTTTTTTPPTTSVSSPVNEWLDQVASSMGMAAFEVIDHDDVDHDNDNFNDDDDTRVHVRYGLSALNNISGPLPPPPLPPPPPVRIPVNNTSG